VALGSFAYLGIDGWRRARDLRSSCAPGCDPADVDQARLRLHLADASLAVGVVALAGAGWLVWRGHAGRSPAADVALVPGGALLRLGGGL
jgi:hypothetical protein